MSILVGALTALVSITFLRSNSQFDAFNLRNKVLGSYNAPLLAAGQPFHKQLVAGESHLYRIALDTGQFLHVLLRPLDLDAHVTLYGPVNNAILEFNCQQNKVTPISLVATTAGSYRLEIRSLKNDTRSGRYEVRLKELRRAVPEDHLHIAAEKAFAEGEGYHDAGDAESQRKAVQKYEEALRVWKTVGAVVAEAGALKTIGDVLLSLGESQKSLEYYERSFSLRRELNDKLGEGETLNATGYAYLTLGENKKALALCNQALDLSRATANKQGEAQALNNVGEIYYGSGDLPKSLELYQQALPIWQALNDHRGQAQSLLNLGYTYSDMGESQKAADCYKQALHFWRNCADRRGQAQTLTAIGRLYSRLGESQESLNYFEQALRLAQPLGYSVEEADILNGIGYVREVLGEHQNALGYYTKSLGLYRKAGHRSGEATTLHEIGRVHYSMGDIQNALDSFQRCVSMSRAIPDLILTSYALRGIGMAYDTEKTRTKALKYYNQTLPLYRAGNNLRGEASVLNLIGRVHHSWGRAGKALGYYQRALRLNQATGDRIRESLTLYNIACAERDRGRLDQALAHIEESLQIVESLRTKVASRELRTSYFASIQQYYELNIDLLMRRRERGPSNNFAVAALEASERARMRSLLELLAEAHAEIHQDGDPALVQRARALQQQINALAERKAKLLRANAPQDEINTVVREVETLLAERDLIEDQIRVKSPRYAALTQPQPSSFKEIQRLLDDNTLLLEYALGSERSYLWAATRDGLKSYELPNRAEIEKVARPVYDLLATYQPDSAQPEKQRETEYWRQASALSQMLLKPVADLLGDKRLLIVADGVLQYIPFAALPIPDSRMGGDKETRGGGNKKTRGIPNPQSPIPYPQSVPLIVGHEIVNLPSASTLAALRREMAGRRPAPKTIAVLADPVFQFDDLRLLAAIRKGRGAVANQTASNNPPPITRSQGRTRGGEIFMRLHATENEARAIEEVTSDKERLVVRGFEANRARVTGPELSQYRIIHFATHAVLDRDNPELSAIVLSLFDQQGKPQDGLLHLHDIYNLNLPAELVVLSACNTGLGKEIKGEGLIGLTRGFMYAGSARVMASLWKVEDEATSNLMKRFYQYMLKEGLPAAAALRKAQVSLWQDSQWRAPSYWAAFTLQGEWR